MHTTTLAPKNMNQGNETLIRTLQSFAEDGALAIINVDLLCFLMSEFIGSECFIKISGARRKDLFNQFIKLDRSLDCLDNFLSNDQDLLNRNDSIIDLVSNLQSLGEDGGFEEISTDFLCFAMPELIGSKAYEKLTSERREDLFNQYATLKGVLECLESNLKGSCRRV